LPGGRVIRPKVHLYFGTLRIFYGRVVEEMAARLISFVRDIATREVNEFLRIRAGAVSWNGRALIMPSPPEPHLPALTGLLVREGAEYLGDEVIYVDPVLRNVHSTPLPIFLDAEDLPLFPELEREPVPRRPGDQVHPDLRAATPRRLVAPEELGSRHGTPASVAWIVFPYLGDAADTKLEPAGGAEALFRFTESALNLHAYGDRGLRIMREMLESVPVSRLRVASLPQAAELVLEYASSMLEGVRG
jgi:hypothetical protein